MKIFSLLSALFVSAAILAMMAFIALNALPVFSVELFFDDVRPLDAVFRGAFVWEGLYNPLLGSIRLVFIAGLFAVPVGLGTGLYMAEFASARTRGLITALMESFAGIPSIIVGLFGLMLILLLHRFFPARTCLLLAAFCLGILSLPVLALNTYNAVRGVPQQVRFTAASLGLGKYETAMRVVVPHAVEGVISGLLMAAGRCVEDTAVILMTGAVAQAAGSHGLLGKFEALPFFIYYTSANYRNERELGMVFAAAFLLLIITLILSLTGAAIRGRVK